MAQDAAGQRLGDEQQQQPANALADDGQDTRIEVGPVKRLRTAEALEVLRRLLFEHIDHVVDGDDADEHALRVYDRQRSQVIARHEAGDLFLVGAHQNGYVVRLDHVGQHTRRLFDEQLTHADRARQPAVAIDDVDVVDFLGVGLPGAQRDQRLADGHAPAQGQEVGGHQAAGAVFGVEQQRTHLGLVFQLAEDVLPVGRLQLADEVSGLVRLHLVYDAGDGLARQGGDEVGGVFVVEFFQNVGRVFRVEPGQQGRLLFIFQFVEELGLVGRAQGFQRGDGPGNVVVLQRRADLHQDIFQVCVQHGTPPRSWAPWRRGAMGGADCQPGANYSVDRGGVCL